MELTTMAQGVRIIETARLIVRDYDDRLFMFRRPENAKSRPGDWDFAGGKVDAGETITQAAVRELAEETGIIVPESDTKFLFGTTERDGTQWFSRNYLLFVGRLSSSNLLQLTEHDSVMIAPPGVAIGATCFEPNRAAVHCLVQTSVA